MVAIGVGAISYASDVHNFIVGLRADPDAVAWPHLTDPGWTLTKAVKIGYLDVAWPKQYQSAKTQHDHNLERERSVSAQAAGLSLVQRANNLQVT